MNFEYLIKIMCHTQKNIQILNKRKLYVNYFVFRAHNKRLVLNLLHIQVECCWTTMERVEVLFKDRLFKTSVVEKRKNMVNNRSVAL